MFAISSIVVSTLVFSGFIATQTTAQADFGSCADPKWTIELKSNTCSMYDTDSCHWNVPNSGDGDDGDKIYILVGDGNGNEIQFTKDGFGDEYVTTYTACDIKYFKPVGPSDFIIPDPLTAGHFLKNFDFRIKYNGQTEFRQYAKNYNILNSHYDGTFWEKNEKYLLNCYHPDGSSSASCKPCPVSTPHFDGSICAAISDMTSVYCQVPDNWVQTSESAGECAVCPDNKPKVENNACVECPSATPIYHPRDNTCYASTEPCCSSTTSGLEGDALEMAMFFDLFKCGYQMDLTRNRCVPNECACPGGTAALATETYTFDMEGMDTPVDYTCFNHEEVPKTTDDTTIVCASCDTTHFMHHELPICNEKLTECEDGYHLENHQCRPNVCTCEYGQGIFATHTDGDGGKHICEVNGGSNCATCTSGRLYTDESGERKCYEFRCTCDESYEVPRGEPALTEAQGCTANMEVCMNCKDGYYLYEVKDSNNAFTGEKFCLEKHCYCEHGTGAEGTACEIHWDQDNPGCASCHSGYVLFQDKCVNIFDLSVEAQEGDPEFYIGCDDTEAANCGSEPCVRKLTRVVNDDDENTVSVELGDVICGGGNGEGSAASDGCQTGSCQPIELITAYTALSNNNCN